MLRTPFLGSKRGSGFWEYSPTLHSLEAGGKITPAFAGQCRISCESPRELQQEVFDEDDGDAHERATGDHAAANRLLVLDDHAVHG